ncbi:MAG TPA: MmcQ/YjbR family DNA-binding protein [Bryobacteraceae bacterium]|nr:MmcQ/YjbR family DNA-binding protein [Bryobacteraceae bacterium]
MTAADFRRLALALPEATEGAHMGHADFRVRNKIFATLDHTETLGMVKLNPEQQHELVKAQPEIFVPVKGGWGRRGATHVRLEVAEESSLVQALRTAWRNTAPKSLVARS